MPDAPGSTVLVQGKPGPSAYEHAKQQGFQGTEQAWIDSLTGATGPAGQGLINRGDWLSGSTYNPNDYVYHDGSFWMVKGTVPFVSTIPPSSDPANWVEMTPSGGGGGGSLEAASDTTPLISGQNYIDVVFDVAQPNANWTMIECKVVNTTDGSPLNIWPGIMTAKLTTGFRLYLNAMPDSSNYILHWAISVSGGTSGTTAVISGQDYVDVAFSTAQPDNNWFLAGAVVVNTLDSTPLNIWTGMVTVKTTTGFRVQLNGLPDTSHYSLLWAIASSIAFSGGGGSGGTVSVTGTGFLHNTSGALDPASRAVALSGSDISGNLGVTHLNSGSGADASTFWRGDGTWSVPPAGTGGGSDTTPPTAPTGLTGDPTI